MSQSIHVFHMSLSAFYTAARAPLRAERWVVGSGVGSRAKRLVARFRQRDHDAVVAGLESTAAAGQLPPHAVVLLTLRHTLPHVAYARASTLRKRLATTLTPNMCDLETYLAADVQHLRMDHAANTLRQIGRDTPATFAARLTVWGAGDPRTWVVHDRPVLYALRQKWHLPLVTARLVVEVARTWGGSYDHHMHAAVLHGLGAEGNVDGVRAWVEHHWGVLPDGDAPAVPGPEPSLQVVAAVVAALAVNNRFDTAMAYVNAFQAAYPVDLASPASAGLWMLILRWADLCATAPRGASEARRHRAMANRRATSRRLWELLGSHFTQPHPQVLRGRLVHLARLRLLPEADLEELYLETAYHRVRGTDLTHEFDQALFQGMRQQFKRNLGEVEHHEHWDSYAFSPHTAAGLVEYYAKRSAVWRLRQASRRNAAHDQMDEDDLLLQL